MDQRKALMGQVHVRKAKARVCDKCGRITYTLPCQCGSREAHRLRDDEYRECLRMWTGKSSCTQMDEDELRMARSGFDDCGWAAYWKAQGDAHRRRRLATIALIKKEAERKLGDRWADRLDGFIDRVCGADGIYALDDNGLRQVIGWLRRLKTDEAKGTTINQEDRK